MTKGIAMKKLAALSMLLGLGLFVTGCGETKPAPKPSGAPPAVTPETKPGDTTEPMKETTDEMPPKDTTEPAPGETKPEDGAEPAAGEPAADDKPAGDEK
jgi:PBP1b-binding outer membrane lipoprotein LpoB